MAAFGASRPLRPVPAIASFLNPQPTLSLGGGNWSSCSEAVIPRRQSPSWREERKSRIVAGTRKERVLTEVTIRLAGPTDFTDLRRAVVELQEHERRLSSTRLPGDQIADAYLAWLQQQAHVNGAVLIVEVGGIFAGFVVGWVVEETTSPKRWIQNAPATFPIFASCRPIAGNGSPSICFQRSNGILLLPVSRGCALEHWPRTRPRERPTSEPDLNRTKLSTRSALANDE